MFLECAYRFPFQFLFYFIQKEELCNCPEVSNWNFHILCMHGWVRYLNSNKKNKWKDFLCGVFFCRDRNLEITPILLAWNNPFLKQMKEKIRARLLSILQYIKKYGSEWNETRNFTWPLPCIMLNYFTILLCAKFIKNKSGRLWFSTSSCVLLTPGNPSLVQHLRIPQFLLTCASQWPYKWKKNDQNYVTNWPFAM